MRRAAIDIGSNTLRMLVADMRGDVLLPVLYERSITRIAKGLASTGRLDPANAELTLRELARFVSLARERGAEEIVAAGTSALRRAADSADFQGRARFLAGVDVHIVTGGREAELTAAGALATLPGARAAICAVLDIGGGSSELALVQRGKLVRSASVERGVVALCEEALRSDPPSEDDLRVLYDACEALARELVESSGAAGAGEIVCTAGTATTIAGVDMALEVYDPKKVHGHRITLERSKRLYRRLSSIPAEARVRTPGLEPGRADLIIAGLALTIRVVEGIGLDILTVSDQGFLEGLMIYGP